MPLSSSLYRTALCLSWSLACASTPSVSTVPPEPLCFAWKRGLFPSSGSPCAAPGRPPARVSVPEWGSGATAREASAGGLQPGSAARRGSTDRSAKRAGRRGAPRQAGAERSSERRRGAAAGGGCKPRTAATWEGRRPGACQFDTASEASELCVQAPGRRTRTPGAGGGKAARRLGGPGR